MAQPEGWQLSGQGPESYELHLVPALFAAFAASLVTQATLQLGERLLDAACGTGHLSRAWQRPVLARRATSLGSTSTLACWQSRAEGPDAARGPHYLGGRQPGSATVRGGDL